MRFLKINILILLFTVVFISCGDEEIVVPNDVIPEEKMVEVITEIEITQALIKLKFSNQDTINQQHLFDEIYTEFDISEKQFNNSLNYYSRHPVELENIYVKVVTRLSEHQANN